MIVNITQGATFRPAIEYGAGIRKKEKCSELVETHNLLSSDSAGIADEMSCVAGYSKRVKKPVLHMSVNFHPDESPEREVMLKATYAYLEEMKIPVDRHQIVIYEHHDTPHKHFHVFINRVDPDTCTAYDDSFLHVRNEAACRKVEQELGLRPTDSIVKVRREKKERKALGRGEQAPVGGKAVSTTWLINDKDENRFRVRHYVHAAVERALASGVTSREHLSQVLRGNNIEAAWKDDSQGNFVGASFKYDNLSVTGNAAGFTARNLRDIFAGTVAGREPEIPGIAIALGETDARALAELTVKCWREVSRTRKFHFESQAVENFPFTDLVRAVKSRSNFDEAQVFAFVTHFELMKKNELPKIKKRESTAFARSAKLFLKLAGSIKGNNDSRRLFVTAMNLESRGNLLYVREPGHLRYSASNSEMASLGNSQYTESVFIPREFSFAERSVLLNAAARKEIKQSFYDLDPSRIKAIFETELYQEIERQLNQNYVQVVLAASPTRFEEKLEYLRQRGIVIEPKENGGYELGFIGNPSTGEMKSRIAAGDAFAKMLKTAGYSQADYEASREATLSPRGRFMVALAQAIDNGNAKQSSYIMMQAHRLNKDLAGFDDPKDMLEALAGRSGSIKSGSSKLGEEARKIQWKNRRR